MYDKQESVDGYTVYISVENARGCGYRSPGANGVGIYLMGPSLGEVCERLPFPLEICPCCGGGIKPSRGWTWIDPEWLFQPHLEPVCSQNDTNPWDSHHHDRCVMCYPELTGGEGGLLWIGGKFYSTESFLREAQTMGISRKLASIPRDFKIGTHFVYLAHREAITKVDEYTMEEVVIPGVFSVFKPSHIDLVIPSEGDIPDKAKNLVARHGDKVRLVRVIENGKQGEMTWD